jgi:dipeptidyl aminopeptidase/acylaminoacyl peptidase
MAVAHTLGLFADQTDVGTLHHPGSCTYEHDLQTYTIAGAGANMWSDHDDLHFVWKRLSGDIIVHARANFVGDGIDPHRKLGWSIRASLDSNAAHVSAVVHGDGLMALQFRRAAGAQTEEVRAALTYADVIQLERSGTTLIMSVARFGEPFTTIQIADLDLGQDVFVGLFVCAHNPDVLEQAIFRNVRIVIPAKPDFAPYRDPHNLGSHLELVDIASGNRKIIYSSTVPFEAPNWTNDGLALIYNSAGRLYRFDLARNTPTPIDTGFATRNNNDHVISFDGTMLAISHHSAEDNNQSIIYTVPIDGGIPQRVTALGPSYLHGWSPDGRFLVYAGQRNGEFDIYRIAVEGGEETQLTTAIGLDDGPEYTPDGTHIYFNSVRSGSMQIWRMNADGSNQEQVTNDGYNNWFAHIAPDGQSLVFLSFAPEVDPSAHPPYKRVYIRHMPIAGGEPTVLAYVYGGQGTINVPSWSPDSQQVAFVSYSVM